jgi:hypothetical protein
MVAGGYKIIISLSRTKITAFNKGNYHLRTKRVINKTVTVQIMHSKGLGPIKYN